jgi:hypothetical protein
MNGSHRGGSKNYNSDTTEKIAACGSSYIGLLASL